MYYIVCIVAYCLYFSIKYAPCLWKASPKYKYTASLPRYLPLTFTTAKRKLINYIKTILKNFSFSHNWYKCLKDDGWETKKLKKWAHLCFSPSQSEIHSGITMVYSTNKFSTQNSKITIPQFSDREKLNISLDQWYYKMRPTFISKILSREQLPRQ